MSEFENNLGYRVTTCLKFKKKGEGEEGVKGRGGERGEGRRKRSLIQILKQNGFAYL